MINEEIINFQSIVENSDICVIPICARRKFYSKYVQQLVKEIRKLDAKCDPIIDRICIDVLNDISNCLLVRDTSALSIGKRDKWFVFIRPDLMDANCANALYLGNNKITLEYINRLYNHPVREFSQILNLRYSMTEYPDEWSGFVSVWNSYTPSLTIVPEEWHLDIHYIG